MSANFNTMPDKLQKDYGLFIQQFNEGNPGKFVEVNENACSWLGYSKEELLALDMQDIYADKKQNLSSAINNLKDKRKTFFQGKFLARDGSKLELRVNSWLINLDNIQYILNISQNEIIEENRELDMGLWEWDTENIGQHTAVFATDAKGKIVEVNKTAVELSGYSRDELLKMSAEDFVPAERKSKFIDDIDTTQKKGFYKQEYPTLKNDGTVYYTRVSAIKISEDRHLVLVEDIDYKKKAEQILKEQKAYFQQLFDKSPDAIALLDNQEKVIRVNKSFERIFEFNKKEVKGKKINGLVVPESEMDKARVISRNVIKGETFVGEAVRKAKSGKKVYVSINGFPITLDNNQLGIYAVYHDITDRKEEEEKIKFLSFHDQLTGLYNRRYFEQEMERLDKSRRLPISIIVADLDGLKKINDNYGHKEGDRYIEKAADIMKKSTRGEDIVARIGGDEFAVILPESDCSIAEDVKRRIKTKCSECNRNSDFTISISIGCATKNKEDEFLDRVFVKADNAMYQEKNRKYIK